MTDGILSVYYNKTNITDSLAEINETFVSSDAFEITRLSESSISSVFQNKVSITVNISVGILHFTTSVPDKYKGQTQGLLGNYNGNKNDDLTNSSGFIFDFENEMEIFEFGESCELNTCNLM